MPLGSTAIVMMDTRRMDRLAGRAMTIKYPQLAFELNRGYACAHGYDFLYLHMSRETCSHPQLGERHPSYCKLPAVAAALRRWPVVVLIDSDSWFVPGAPSVEALTQANGERVGAPSLHVGLSAAVTE